jgi:hypothetical protein
MTPELVKTFATEFEAELRRNAAQASTERASVLKHLATIERMIAGIVRAIEDGATPRHSRRG